ncbi:hypothetical protein EYF80_006994 [Liparis tanakae]|uniref:Uncharacterized protein n=1 Tax=Liparis tanakae TaxID=230148 RepID=A0A4Z2IZY1_9TELE|nr:hypothetical protein EYF80_006994 [Liparis tanakae]
MFRHASEEIGGAPDSGCNYHHDASKRDVTRKPSLSHVYAGTMIVEQVQFSTMIVEQVQFSTMIVKQVQFSTMIVKQVQFSTIIPEQVQFSTMIDYITSPVSAPLYQNKSSFSPYQHLPLLPVSRLHLVYEEVKDGRLAQRRGFAL